MFKPSVCWVVGPPRPRVSKYRLCSPKSIGRPPAGFLLGEQADIVQAVWHWDREDKHTRAHRDPRETCTYCRAGLGTVLKGYVPVYDAATGTRAGIVLGEVSLGQLLLLQMDGKPLRGRWVTFHRGKHKQALVTCVQSDPPKDQQGLTLPTCHDLRETVALLNGCQVSE